MDASIENAQRYNPFVNNSEYFNFGIVQAIRQPAIKPTSTTWERFCKALESPKIREMLRTPPKARQARPTTTKPPTKRATAMGNDTCILLIFIYAAFIVAYSLGVLVWVRRQTKEGRHGK